MDARLLLTVSTLSACLPLLAGCAAPSDDGLLTAQEAIAQAQAMRPHAQAIAVSGVEGALPRGNAGPSESQAHRDDGVADGALGDGRLSSWVVSLLDGAAYVEARAHADGRTTFAELPMPAALHDEKVFVAIGQPIDSDRAAEAALASDAYARGAGRAAGYLYAYSLVEHRHKPYDNGDREATASELGGLVHSDSWAITHVTADPATSQLVATTAHVAAAGEVLECTIEHLVESVQVFDGPITLRDPPASARTTTHHVVFEVPEGTQRLQGGMDVRPFSTLPNDEVRVRLLQPDGHALHVLEGRAFLPLLVDAPQPGTWSFEVTSSVPGLQDSVVLNGRLVAVRPLLP